MRKMRVFISYSTKDEKLVSCLKSYLGNLVEVYLAPEDPQPGQILAEKIRQEIGKSDLFIVLLTPNSTISSYVNQEIGYAEGIKKPVIPVVLEGTPDKALAMLQGREYIKFDPQNPEKTREQILKVVSRIQENIYKEKGQENFILGMIVGFLFMLFLLALASEQ